MLITTSRKPSPRTRSFCRDLERVLHNFVYENRGKMNFEQVVERARERGERLVMVLEHMGNPGKLVFFDVSSDDIRWLGPSIYIKGVKLQREHGDLVSSTYTTIYPPYGGDEMIEKMVNELSRALLLDVGRDGDVVLRVERDRGGNLCIQFYSYEVPVGPLIRIHSVRFTEDLPKLPRWL